ncbi:MAG: hypothetical protein A3F17_08440 [Gammaproteobacteria bacterium RIFCSPHIGHO2_12_FULL_41_15]|nr:MAG: hypothetical protein A3F17_08440 [Gammaproteobacteria bacterium RIFCSPHIGHO2_12_FULL_41_15]
MQKINENHPQKHEQTIKPGERIALCRCWQSKTFPYCDGSHRAHNEICGDRVGPAVITVDSTADDLV